MQTTIAQAVALAIYGNFFLREGYMPGFYPDHSVFKFCKKVGFTLLEREGSGLQEIPYAKDPSAWFQRSAADRVQGLRVHYSSLDDPRISDRMSVAFAGGGGKWLLETVKPTASDYWEARWKVGDLDESDRRIWKVTYGRVAWDQEPPPSCYSDLAECAEGLEQALRDIAEFARQQQLGGFSRCFEQGLACLRSGQPLPSVFSGDVAPHNLLSPEASRLLAAAEAAWVFGGMGSWNDLSFEDAGYRAYEDLSDRLYRLLNIAIVAAANTTYEPCFGSSRVSEEGR